MSDYISRSYCYDKEVGHETEGNTYSQYSGDNIFNKQNVCERNDWQLHDGVRSPASEDGGTSFIVELEKILSTQLQILNIARLSALKCTGSCRRFQCSRTESKEKELIAKEKQHFMTVLEQCDGIEIPKHSNTSTEPYKSVHNNITNIENTLPLKCQRTEQVLQPLQLGKTASETHGIDTFHAQVIDSTKQDDEKTKLKKAAHNRVEKRRRYFINERIAELQSLLPENVNRSSSVNKGTILQESVDFIKRLQANLKPIRKLQERVLQIDRENKQLATRIEVLESKTAKKLDMAMTEPQPKVHPIMTQHMDIGDIPEDIFAEAF